MTTYINWYSDIDLVYCEFNIFKSVKNVNRSWIPMRLINILWLFVCPFLFLIAYSIYYINEGASNLNIDRDNFLNVIFVKKGWFWTTIVVWYSLFMTNVNLINKKFIKRYFALTFWWYVFTQGISFLNIPPVMDIWFVYTGGVCSFDVFDDLGGANITFQDTSSRRVKAIKKLYSILLKNTDGVATQGHIQRLKCALDNKSNCNSVSSPPNINADIKNTVFKLDPLVDMVSSNCRAHGGHWVGGHDPSGHMFILTLMIMLISSEIPRIIKFKYLRSNGRIEDESKKESSFKRICISITKLFDNGAIWNIINNNPTTVSEYIYQVLILPPLTFASSIIKILFLITKSILIENPVILLTSLLLLWAYSFLVTIIVFHTISEQITGFLSAYIMAVIIYKFL
ncbi:hypothetical protein Kpol_461p2 [Vanderwaltozyma polyspora DSM 70294]|uniref:Acyl-coenzyme A diphosphatase SCS3 n=1 Tax=Vanderwaltozyma polyspora (strain ATCC 22028 / DSM 70294 / BCRC 21397 / CBS 2163 / NBRC 10782 / NRRL Y-8283 / UCD 57-17) TaxID=436907 RepID=A7TR39_VANPO|nr:uncharacterized protein Kpol_461p2 [Vanderwaltozyma polyspora DSM 70294]EDO15249.1 hypothetical protein Kpol_461p2 [Vanderwaltozyma polyspora DSM 70294]